MTDDFPVLIRSPRAARHALTSIPWPADHDDVPTVEGIAHQIVPLFEPVLTPRLRRFLLLTHSETSLPTELKLAAQKVPSSASRNFSNVEIKTLHEALDTKQYTYRECE